MKRLLSSLRHRMLPILLVSPLVVLSLAATAMNEEGDRGRAVEGGLDGRISAYWEALSQRDWATAYALEASAKPNADGYLNPFDYAEALTSLPRFKSPTVLSTQVAGDSATSIVRVLYVIPVGPAVVHSRRYYESTWKRDDGQWLQASHALISPRQLSARYPKIAAEHGVDLANDVQPNDVQQSAEMTRKAADDGSSDVTPADSQTAEEP